MNKSGSSKRISHTAKEKTQARCTSLSAALPFFFAFAVLILLSGLVSCGHRAYENAGSISLQPEMDAKRMSVAESDMAGSASAPEQAMPGAPPVSNWTGVLDQKAFAQETTASGVKPMIIYNGSLAIKVAKLKDASDTVLKMLPKYDGYVSNMSESTQGTMQLVTITVRVDAGKVMDFIAEVKKVGEVLSSDLTGDEVTEEFVDLQAQLSALRISEARLKDMLSKSGKLSDLLEIERELSNKQAQINQVMGRMRYLSDRSSRATVEITLQTEAPPPPSTIQFAWGFGEVFQQAWVNLKYTVRSFIAGVITFAVSALFWLPALAVVAWVLLLFSRRLRRIPTAKP